MLDEVFKSAVDNQCGMAVHCGDLFDVLGERIDKKTFLDVYQKFVEFSKHGILVVLMVGNHDWIDRTETNHIIEPFREIDNVIVIDKPEIFEKENANLVFVPFTRSGFEESLVKMGCSSRMKQYLFTHQGVSGAKIGPRDVILKSEFPVSTWQPEKWTRIFNGHYHTHQDMTSNFHIIGSPLQKDFGERNGVKGYALLDTKTDSYKFIPIESAPKFFKVVRADGETFGEYSEKDFVWIVSENEEVIPDMKTLNIRFEKVGRKEERPRTDIRIEMPATEQFDLYLANKASDLDKARLLSMLVDYYKRAL